jgi:hypothetical protein
MSKYTLIHVEPSDDKALTLKEIMINKFTKELSNLYKPIGDTMEVYDVMRETATEKNDVLTEPIIVFSSDVAISGATIAGYNEKYRQGMTTKVEYVDKTCDQLLFSSPLKILCISSTAGLQTEPYTYYEQFKHSFISDNLNVNDYSYSKARVPLDLHNVYHIGLNMNYVDENELNMLNQNVANYFTIDDIYKKNIFDIMNHIMYSIGEDPVHVIFNMNVFQKYLCPSAHRPENAKHDDDDDDDNNGLNHDQLIVILKYLKKIKHLHSVDIVGYNFGSREKKDDHMIANVLTIKLIDTILSNLITIKKKSINIYNEETKFLIWKRTDDDYNDFGWFILRHMTTEEKEEIIKSIDDEIITVPITNDDETFDVYITTTTIKEQHEKSFYCATSVIDCCLYPGEKLNMTFELINKKTNEDVSDIIIDIEKSSLNQIINNNNNNDDDDDNNIINDDVIDDDDDIDDDDIIDYEDDYYEDDDD